MTEYTHRLTHAHIENMQQQAGAERAELSINSVQCVNEAPQCCSLSSAVCVRVVMLRGLKARHGHTCFLMGNKKKSRLNDPSAKNRGVTEAP